MYWHVLRGHKEMSVVMRNSNQPAESRLRESGVGFRAPDKDDVMAAQLIVLGRHQIPPARVAENLRTAR
jgi:hypothetical protein